MLPILVRGSLKIHPAWITMTWYAIVMSWKGVRWVLLVTNAMELVKVVNPKIEFSVERIHYLKYVANEVLVSPPEEVEKFYFLFKQFAL